MSMQDDVLEPFAEEWAERKRQQAEAIARLGAAHAAPRIEPFTDNSGDSRYMLVRTDGEVSRIKHGRDARAVTIRFTPSEWAMIERVVLLRHGLAVADNRKDEQ